MKVNLPTHISPTRNWQLFSILTHPSNSKCKDRLLMLNVYKITAKENQVVDSWAADEYQFRKNFRLTISSFLSAQYFLVAAAQKFSRNRRSVALI